MAARTKKSLSEQLTLHQVLLQKYADGRIARAIPALREMAQKLRRLIVTELTDDQLFRMRMIEADIASIISSGTGEIMRQTLTAINELAPYEAAFTAEMMGRGVRVAVNGITPEAAIAAVTRSQMRLVSGKRIVSLSMQEMIKRFDGGVYRDVMGTIRGGAVMGTPPDQMAREVYNLVGARTKSQVQALVRTTTNHIASTARAATMQANQDILDGERWTATLDDRTRAEHAAMDGRVYPVGEGPRAPAGYNCRCLRVPVIRAALRIPGLGVQRASVDGPVDGRLTYDGFLRKQSEEFQDEVLGESKASLFRAGMPINKFADAAGRPLSLAELRALDGQMVL